jgi:sugar diacid utilization regulator
MLFMPTCVVESRTCLGPTAPYLLEEIPRAQVRAVRPKLERILKGSDDRGILRGYKEHGYRLHEIAEYLGVHYATVSRRLKRMEEREGDV